MVVNNIISVYLIQVRHIFLRKPNFFVIFNANNSVKKGNSVRIFFSVKHEFIMPFSISGRYFVWLLIQTLLLF